jgi:hypothetical protein
VAGVAVERVRAAEWRELRELRLRALADAPEAFASTLAREAAFPDDVWRQRAQGRAGPTRRDRVRGRGLGRRAPLSDPSRPRH